MKAYLYEDNAVEIDPAAAELGGSFQGRRADGAPCSWDQELVRLFDQEMLAPLPTGALFADVGASTGGFTLLAGGRPDLRVVAWEPHPQAYPLLVANVALNGLTARATIYSEALGAAPGTGLLQIPGTGEAGLACLGNLQRCGAVSQAAVVIRTLDSYDLPRLDALKIDVEGMELFVLQGGEQTIRRYRPAILLEVWSPNAAQFGLQGTEVLDLLRSWGAVVAPVSTTDWRARWP